MQFRTNVVDGDSNSIEDIMSDKDGKKDWDLITGSSKFAARDTKFNFGLYKPEIITSLKLRSEKLNRAS